LSAWARSFFSPTDSAATTDSGPGYGPVEIARASRVPFALAELVVEQARRGTASGDDAAIGP
jgi:hypothetical protein